MCMTREMSSSSSSSPSEVDVVAWKQGDPNGRGGIGDAFCDRRSTGEGVARG